MREILFRGKRADNGEWIYGSLLVDYPCCKNGVDETVKLYSILDFKTNEEEVKKVEVIPETVGQYTGLTDKNGKKIFEGDILSYIEEIETRSRGKETLKGIYEVKFEYCGFSPLDCLACNHLEIIGNIYDNPELLKGCEK